MNSIHTLIILSHFIYNKLMGYCYYCQQEKTLIDAHILPRKFYIKDSSGSYQGVHTDGTYKIWQCGFYDKNILCGDCDNILGQYDKEAYRLLLDIDTKKQRTTWNKIRAYHYTKEEFDYEKIRKFFISLIWRAAISKGGFNRIVDLGKYENIALEILKGNMENDNLFKVIVFTEDKPNDFTNVHYIMKTRIERQIAYAVYFTQFVAYIIPHYKKFNPDTFKIFNMLTLNPNDFVIAESLVLANTKRNFLTKTFSKGIQSKIKK